MGSAVKDRGGCLKLIPKSYKEQTKYFAFITVERKKMETRVLSLLRTFLMHLRGWNGWLWGTGGRKGGREEENDHEAIKAARCLLLCVLPCRPFPPSLRSRRRCFRRSFPKQTLMPANILCACVVQRARVFSPGRALFYVPTPPVKWLLYMLGLKKSVIILDSLSF